MFSDTDNSLSYLLGQVNYYSRHGIHLCMFQRKELDVVVIQGNGYAFGV